MFDQNEFAREFFVRLTAIDAAIVARVAAGDCPLCGGPLHRGDYDRKPRGGVIAVAAEAFNRRYSLCCGREGCRRRATPPSVRFLGRRVYVGAVVIVASVLAMAAVTASASRRATGSPLGRHVDGCAGGRVRSSRRVCSSRSPRSSCPPSHATSFPRRCSRACRARPRSGSPTCLSGSRR